MEYFIVVPKVIQVCECVCASVLVDVNGATDDADERQSPRKTEEEKKLRKFFNGFSCGCFAGVFPERDTIGFVIDLRSRLNDVRMFVCCQNV